MTNQMATEFIDDVTVAAERYLDLQAQPIDAQMEFFCERFVFELGREGLLSAYKIQKDFENAVASYWNGSGISPQSKPQYNNHSKLVRGIPAQRASAPTTKSNEEEHELEEEKINENDDAGSVVSSQEILDTPANMPEKTYLPLQSTELTWFLERRGKPMMQLHRRVTFLGLSTKDGGIDLIGYLLYHFRRPILLQYFHRRNRKAPKGSVGLTCNKDLGNNMEGFEMNLHGERKKVAEALKEELFLRVPFGVDNVLDAGLLQFDSMLEPIKKNIIELRIMVEDSELSAVQRNTARSELATLEKSYTEASVSFVRIKVYIDKLKKKQHQAFLDLKEELNSHKRNRQMTLAKYNK